MKKMDYLKDYGLRRSVALYTNFQFQKIFTSIFRKNLRPSLGYLSSMSSVTSMNPMEVLEAIFKVDSNDLIQIRDEFEYLTEILKGRQTEYKLAFPANFALGSTSSLLIYSLIRIGKPKIIVETGVANGVSTFLILNAIKKNGLGHLISFDVSKKAGILLSEMDRTGWEFVQLRRHYKAEFSEKISKLPLIDFFLHDSDHSYRWQKFEYATVFQRLSEKSIFVSDDIDSSYAFVDFCGLKGIKPMVLVEPTKVLGCFRL